jgi:hypothetical protein
MATNADCTTLAHLYERLLSGEPLCYVSYLGDGFRIHDVSRNDSGTYTVWTNYGGCFEDVDGSRAVYIRHQAPATTLPQAPATDTFTLSQARGRIVSTLMRDYDAAQIAHRLLLVDPSAHIPNGATSRSLASKLAWVLLPSGPERGGDVAPHLQVTTQEPNPLLVEPGARVQCRSDRAYGLVRAISSLAGRLAYLVDLDSGTQRLVVSTDLIAAGGA